MAAKFFKRSSGVRLVARIFPHYRSLDGVEAAVWLMFACGIWITWSTRDRRVLFVYSNSPNWKEYIEQRILPRLPANTVIMNWSERKKWSQLSLPVRAFHYFCGDVNCNPAAVVFRPFRVAKTFRLWQPFRDYKHGKAEPLVKVEREMFDYIETK